LPGWQSIVWNGYKIYAKPDKRWRHIVPGKYLSYVYGTKPKFNIYFERIDNTNPEQKFQWFIQFSNGHTTGGDIELPDMKQGDTYTQKIGGMLLGYSGDAILGLNVPRLLESKYHTLYSFMVLPIEDLLISVLITVVAVLLGFMLNYSC